MGSAVTVPLVTIGLKSVPVDTRNVIPNPQLEISATKYNHWEPVGTINSLAHPKRKPTLCKI